MSVSSERRRIHRAILLQPCLPRRANTPPTGHGWIHEIKHDGFRIMARRGGDRVRIFTRNGYDFTTRFPKIAAAVENCPYDRAWSTERRSSSTAQGLSVFDLLYYRQHDHAAVLCAFDLVEFDGYVSASSRSSAARARSLIFSDTPATVLPSTTTSQATAQRFSRMPARSAARASYRNGLERRIALVGSITG
jgi:ATP-dependent DNA ligase